ncbi:MAG TPA: hypothetical protein VMM12_06940 [Longimicrobiales bacterium]|nr:hypothetical protein [Longimicrobiales bacterium]
MIRRLGFTTALALALLAAPTGSAGQVHSMTANPFDVETIDGIIQALYASISGPAGPRDWHRFHSLFLRGAILMNAGPRSDSMPPPPFLSPEGYRERVAPYFLENAFYEVEATRRVERFGTIAHVWSTYLSRRAPGEEPFSRGINSIQLVWHQGRWWVGSIIWDSERPATPLPAAYLPDSGGGR